jgi:hypothetical protein
VTFPSPGAVTDAQNLVVRGTTEGPDTVVSVRVNGASATSTDGFATWRTSIVLSPGRNTLAVTLTDDLGRERTDATALEVEQVAAVLQSPIRLAHEPVRSTWLVLERRQNALLRLDPATGVARVLSSATRGAGTPFDGPTALAVDTGGDAIYVGDTGNDTVFAVDPGTGDRTVVVDRSAASAQGLSGILSNLTELVFDDMNRRLLAADSGSDTVFAIDPGTGTISLISGGNNAQPALRRGSGTSIFSAAGMGWDESGNRVIVVDNQADQVVAVNLTTGNRTVLSSNSAPAQPTGPDFTTPTSLELDAGRRFAYVTDVIQPGVPNRVLEVDLSTGARRELSGENVGSGTDLEFPQSCRIDTPNQRLLVGDAARHTIFAVDLQSGARTRFYDTRVGEGPRFADPFGTSHDATRARLLVADRSLRALVAVDLRSGDRRVLTQFDGSTTPYDVTIDTIRDRALVVDVQQSRVFAVALGTGTATELPVAALSNIRHIGFDPARDRALVSRATATNGSAFQVWSIDLANPDPNSGELPVALLSRSTTPPVGSGPSMTHILDLTVDADTDVALVLEQSGGGEVLAVDLDSGDRSLISGSGRGTGNGLQNPRSFAPQPGAPRVLVLNRSGDETLSVDLNTGDRSLVTGEGRGEGPRIRAAVDVAATRVSALVLDYELGVVTVDLGSGDRVISSSR